jgi:hypothetical protein
MLAKFVDRATMAFTKMNATDTPTVWRISARPKRGQREELLGRLLGGEHWQYLLAWV